MSQNEGIYCRKETRIFYILHMNEYKKAYNLGKLYLFPKLRKWFPDTLGRQFSSDCGKTSLQEVKQGVRIDLDR